MKVEPNIILTIQLTVDDPKNGAKVTAARIGIGRVTLWRLLTLGKASGMTLRRVVRFIVTTETLKRNNQRIPVCTLTI